MNLKIGALLVAALGILGFFLPWVKPLLLTQKINPLEVVDKLLDRQKPDFLYDYILMTERDAKDAFQSPAEGASGFQIALAERYEGGVTGAAALTVSDFYFGDRKLDWHLRILWILPTLTLMGIIAILLRPGGKPGVVLTGVALLALYGLIRWRMTEATQIHLEAAYGIGLWLSIYAAAILGIVAIFTGLFSGEGKKARGRK